MTPFDFQPLTRMVVGVDSINQLGTLAAEFGIQRVLVVTDPGIVAAGHAQRGIDSLTAAGLTTETFDGARENPTTNDVNAGLEIARQFKPEMIVGLGGGSSMDCAKGINFLLSNGGEMKDYWGVGKATRDMLPMIAVPTTSGTGSEMQSFALISDVETHVKMACGDKRASCRIAILDPRLTLTQPETVTALTGIDAISHALETYVTTKRNPISLIFSREAWKLLAGNFRKVLRDPNDLQARAAMQLGAAYAGVAIENSMLGASHALANPLTATYSTAHGQAIGAVLPHVIRFNGEEFNPWYCELLQASEEIEGCPPADSGAEGLAQFVTELVAAAGMKVELKSLGVENSRLLELADAAAKQWTGTFNPRKVNAEALLGLYENAY